MLEKTAVSTNAVDGSDLGAGFELIVQPLRHAILPGVRAELGFLAMSVHDLAMTYTVLTPRRALLSGGLTDLSGFAKGLKVRILLPMVLFSLLLAWRPSLRVCFFVLRLWPSAADEFFEEPRRVPVELCIVADG
jgi:hypothetical protein